MRRLRVRRLHGDDRRSTCQLLHADGETLSNLQSAFLDQGGVQCGFCTPGMLVSAHALLRENADPTEEEVRLALGGNLCRCTGYTKIASAVMQAAKASV